MKLLLDQGLPRSTVAHLAAQGVVSQHVSSLGMASASDEDILKEAERQQATVVTLDADFHQILATTRVQLPSVIRIRIEGLKGDRLAALLLQVISQAGTDLTTGAAVSVTENRIRVRSVPIGH
jgi:predicted nuclease of predicted toxin-antitoxin system